jgi:hypothetical protein
MYEAKYLLIVCLWVSADQVIENTSIVGVGGEKYMNENMYGVLVEVLKRSDLASNIGNAILYECICTITTIHVSPRLLEIATAITFYFLKVVLSQLSCRRRLLLCY